MTEDSEFPDAEEEPSYEVFRVRICREHTNALVSAAVIHECRDDQSIRDFVADCLASGLHEAVRRLMGGHTGDQCPCCAYLHPHAAINDAVAAAVARRRHLGRSPSLN
jgi:hypothetical protein